VSEEDLDQRPGAGLITETAPGRRPVVLVVDAERPAGPGSGQGGGAGEGTRLDPQHLQVVIEHE
jgi:hypothetical protein